MKYKKVMSRRTMLRGAGTVAIGLPLMEAMRTTSVFAAAPEPPVRAYNVFFGLGMPTPLHSEGYSGVIEPLMPVQDKLAILRGVDQVRADEGGINAHFDGAAAAFTAEPPNGEARAGGPSIDQVLRRTVGEPGPIPTLLMGTYFRRSRPARYIHSWNDDGSPADLPYETPRALFDRVFGQDPMMMPGDDPAAERQNRIRQSVLDSVVTQYQHYMSDNGNLGAESRNRMREHLERIREHENRVFDPGVPNTCMVPTRPAESTIPHNDAADPGGQGIDITLTDLTNEWRLMADSYALAVQCDLVRFGAVTFQAAGERIRLTGNYRYDGRDIYDFNDQRDLGQGGDRGCSHEFWHQFNEGRQNEQLRAHNHLMMREINYLLEQLADPAFADENGLSILENALVTISTESGDGRHSNSTRELSGVFHAISGANERFKTGEIIDVNEEGLDVYNTILEAYGSGQRLGPGGRSGTQVTSILR